MEYRRRGGGGEQPHDSWTWKLYYFARRSGYIVHFERERAQPFEIRTDILKSLVQERVTQKLGSRWFRVPRVGLAVKYAYIFIWRFSWHKDNAYWPGGYLSIRPCILPSAWIFLLPKLLKRFGFSFVFCISSKSCRASSTLVHIIRMSTLLYTKFKPNCTSIIKKGPMHEGHSAHSAMLLRPTKFTSNFLMCWMFYKVHRAIKFEVIILCTFIVYMFCTIHFRW
jgi:hypothetical protein